MTTRRGFLALFGGAALAACVPDTKKPKPGKFPPETYAGSSWTAWNGQHNSTTALEDLEEWRRAFRRELRYQATKVEIERALGLRA